MVDSALSGQEALQKYIPHKYKLIILDNVLPDLRGDKVADQTLEQDDAKNMEIHGNKMLVNQSGPSTNWRSPGKACSKRYFILNRRHNQ